MTCVMIGWIAAAQSNFSQEPEKRRRRVRRRPSARRTDSGRGTLLLAFGLRPHGGWSHHGEEHRNVSRACLVLASEICHPISQHNV